MKILNFFFLYSQNRKFWLILTISAFIIEIITFYFQYIIKLKPCLLCIYEQITIFAILVAGSIAFISPKSNFRFLGLILWLYSSWIGLKLTWQHNKLNFYESNIYYCNFILNVQPWSLIKRWIPSIFETYNNCIKQHWLFLNIEISIWLLIIFIIYFLIATIVLFSQILLLKK
ncbi:Disulfide bond formation protein B [Candidatus Arsenophonus lipoptenae]|uniref:Disulfide bond formation protein B n=1 Tax=Candidatus Arsenophonus lipoptenae TaxID=634113 RepID=A0A0X9VDM4_9GAMM|nr:disulfide bond formation protein DsbB [Candidatus Arsenophonus lipoptenae]AMA64659.1 Disulfide bond formation protein B [Candidatus Arsenophonus lipoptenae]